MAFLFLLARIGFGQDQERKLIDRLLRPDMELKNEAQSKKFVAGRMSVNKQANISTFHVQRKVMPSRYLGTKKLLAPEYGAGSFPDRKRQANTTSRNEIANAQRQLPTRLTSDVHAFHDSNRVAQSGEFTGQRPFLDQGKSQRSLYQKNEPLTIDEVRELLNKNK
jgi:hypothetical protein